MNEKHGIIVANVRDGVEGEYVGRPARGRKGSPLGNPFVIGPDGFRDDVVAKYREALLRITSRRTMWDVRADAELERLTDLYRERGSLTLLCWCSPLPCHGDVIRDFILERVGES